MANDVSRQDIAFDSDANEVTVFRRDGEPVFLAAAPKAALAAALLDLFGGYDCRRREPRGGPEPPPLRDPRRT